MKTLTLNLKITTFLLLIWMYQYFYNCDSYKILIDKYILQTKNELKYERILTEGDIAGKMQTYSEGCIEEYSLDDKKNKWENLLLQQNPYDRWQKVTNPSLLERFKKETCGMDPKWIDEKWNNEWNNISANKVNELSSIFDRSDISEEEKGKLIRSVMKELYRLYFNFIGECKKEMSENKTESESKIGMSYNKTESESWKEMRENKTESECMKEMRDNKTEFKSMKDVIDNKKESESESEKEMRENKEEYKYKNEQGKNKKKKKKSNILKFLFCRCDNH
ncbi:fam-g protein [Plasmodium gallinaceum]|uniref:Fam-g protein n=1 Tax=Plasmodium gallinaceum TaxID=5849 RepID=A0A1J1GUU4_PLAGA|nr:fam-g protein [Plasmodium gallinaceum]CRG96011.1 fam-g protein [Plasmodium gallinaceum]